MGPSSVLDTAGDSLERFIQRDRRYENSPELPARPDPRRLKLKGVLGLLPGGMVGVFWHGRGVPALSPGPAEAPAVPAAPYGVRAGFIYGSLARDDTRPDSDVDLFVVAEGLERSELSGHLMDAGMALGREVNPLLYDPEEFRAKARDPGPYLCRVLEGPKIWLIGSEEGLRALRS